MMKNVGRTLALLAIIPLLFVASGSAAEVAKKVAVLPFQINADRDLAYLRNGILDMLSSRLAWEGKVEVVEKQLVKEAMAGHQGPLNEAAAREIGTSLGVDYVLFGSLTIFGESVSIDSKMVPLTTDKPPVTIYAQTKGMGEVIPRINDFAQDINNKIFGRAPTAVAAAPVQPRFSQENPEKLIAPRTWSSQAPAQPPSQTYGQAPGQRPAQPGQGSSQLNPYFVAPSSVSQGQGAFWQSQKLELAITSMAVADVNADGINEVILLSPRELHIYRPANTLHLLKKFEGRPIDHFIWVSVADLNHNQIPEIYVSNRSREKVMASFALEWNGTDWAKVGESIDRHVRTVNLPNKGTVLLGQKGIQDEPFYGGVEIMNREGEKFIPFEGLPLPRGANIYNFTLADVTKERAGDILTVSGNSGSLKLRRSDGEKLWEGGDIYGASFDYLKGKSTETDAAGWTKGSGGEIREKIYLNAPILTADLNQDGRTEVIVNKNSSGIGLARDLININFFGRSELYSFSWNGLTLVENWHTPAFDGMSTAYEVADLNGDGQKELLVVLVSDPGEVIWKEAKSRVVVYPIAAPGKKEKKG
ncbi:MAG: hypothetical protein PVF76_14395 [Syntrophobacterales bacterium]